MAELQIGCSGALARASGCSHPQRDGSWVTVPDPAIGDTRPGDTERVGDAASAHRTRERTALLRYPTQLAFVYRNTAENERQNTADPGLRPSGVHLPGCSGNGTPVRWGGRVPAAAPGEPPAIAGSGRYLPVGHLLGIARTRR